MEDFEGYEIWKISISFHFIACPAGNAQHRQGYKCCVFFSKHFREPRTSRCNGSRGKSVRV